MSKFQATLVSNRQMDKHEFIGFFRLNPGIKKLHLKNKILEN